jgi:diguanylate cyclase (GGDEF)-like protein
MRDRSRSIDDLSQEVALVCSVAGRIEWIDDRLRRLAGDLTGRSWDDLIAPEARSSARRLLDLACAGPTSEWDLILALPEMSRPFTFRGAPIPGGALLVGSLVPEGSRDSIKRIARLDEEIATLRREARERDDVLRATEAELARLTHSLGETRALLERVSITDELTGVANRRRLDDFFAAEWRRAVREGSYLSFLLADVDHFKAYNDHYGHPAGDVCLREVARALDAGVGRSGDLVGRYGGEEFGVVLANTDPVGAATVAERLRAAVEAAGLRHAASPVADFVTISVGGATIRPSQASSVAILLKAADDALYRAKRGGRNRVEMVAL